MAAEQGIKAFFATSNCFARAQVRRVPLEAPIATERLDQVLAETSPKPNRVLTITERELGPIVKLLASLVLVEGGTDFLLEISSYDGANPGSRFDFGVHWQHGGPWVLMGTGTSIRFGGGGRAQHLARAHLAGNIAARRSTTWQARTI